MSPAPPRLAIATRQTAGRGRRGRAWIAEPGRSACLSLAFEARGAPRSGLSLAIGCGVAATLSALTDGIALKWPNDVLRHGRKCGGILIESRPGRTDHGPLVRVVIGMGLNLFPPPDIDGLGQPAGGLFDEGTPAPTLESVIAAAAHACERAYRAHHREGLAPFIEQWERFDAWRGQEVEVSDSGQVLMRGLSSGLTADGALRLTTDEGERLVISGDLSLRRAGSPG
jgi:BirA family biotin operon repressor/biotin-[acetyl-CoA-carboxylase] ligase